MDEVANHEFYATLEGTIPFAFDALGQSFSGSMDLDVQAYALAIPEPTLCGLAALGVAGLGRVARRGTMRRFRGAGGGMNA
jgi:hypothetical protein